MKAITYEQDLDIHPFSEIDHGSSVDGGDEGVENSETDRPELINAIEEQLKSIKNIKARAEEEGKAEERKEPRRLLRGANSIRGTAIPLTEAFLNPFRCTH